jgi:hypothetical protein
MISNEALYISWVAIIALFIFIWSRISSAPEIKSLTVDISHAQLLAINAGIPIIPAIEGKAVMIVDAKFYINGGDAFTDAAEFFLRNNGSSTNFIAPEFIAQNIFEGTDAGVAVLGPNSSLPGCSVELFSIANEIDGGGSRTARLTIRYYYL